MCTCQSQEQRATKFCPPEFREFAPGDQLKTAATLNTQTYLNIVLHLYHGLCSCAVICGDPLRPAVCKLCIRGMIDPTLKLKKSLLKSYRVQLFISFCSRSLFKKNNPNFKTCFFIGQCRVTGSTIKKGLIMLKNDLQLKETA